MELSPHLSGRNSKQLPIFLPSSGIYDSPETAKSFYLLKYKSALHANAGKDPLYYVSIGIYSDNRYWSDSTEIKRIERLTGLGYKVAAVCNSMDLPGESDKTDICCI